MKVVQVSNAFRDIIREKLNLEMRDQLKVACTAYWQARDPYGFLAGMQFAMKFAADGADLLVCTIPQGILVYNLATHSEDEWQDIVKTLEKRQIGTPRKVLVKMLAQRFAKLRKAHLSVNHYRLRDNFAGKPPLDPFPELDTIQKVREYEWYLEKIRELSGSRQEFLEINKIFRREGVDDALVADAWGFTIAREVMDS